MTKELTTTEAEVLAGRFVSEHSTNRWRTADGDSFQLAFMRTDHMFYAFRMLYDMVAGLHQWPTMRPPGTGRQASRKMPLERAAMVMAWFATDIHLRGDLAEEFRAQFKEMLARILGVEQYRIMTKIPRALGTTELMEEPK